MYFVLFNQLENFTSRHHVVHILRGRQGNTHCKDGMVNLNLMDFFIKF